MPVNATSAMSAGAIDFSQGSKVQAAVARASQFQPASQADTDKKLMKTCRQLEGVLFDMMLKEMRKTVPQSTLIGDSDHEQEIFTEMMDQNISEKMADTDTADNGIANLLFRQLSGRKAYGVTGQGVLSGDQAARSAEERKGIIIHETRSFPIAGPRNYPIAQIRAYPAAPAPRPASRAAVHPAGR